ncbi:predicted protein [Histoplasma mississippiense (nom. inval.)]|uniref:predicted protein n=1 Tax=Ajellomyces capsulatus (strain NAm1 / WU24) TaxID=2059318 RepID=UPI000157B8B3|nr:predicted protein [Histoplasma mississippiense (nom. inval.)]EDN03535.1 predicted protein [Histoplasma mississippiense (nom. inval.)]
MMGVAGHIDRFDDKDVYLMIKGGGRKFCFRKLYVRHNRKEKNVPLQKTDKEPLKRKETKIGTLRKAFGKILPFRT